MKLPKIYTHFKQGQLFTIDEARERLGTSGNTLRKRLSELTAKGYLFPIRQGLYCLTQQGERLEKTDRSPYAIAAKLTPECYIGFKTALQLHANEIPPEQDTVYVVSQTKFNSFQFEQRLFFWCQSSLRNGVEEYTLSHRGVEFTICATNFEKSLVDCLKRPAHCPSFLELIHYCERINKVPDMEKILRYATECNVQILFNRIGALLEKIGNKWNVDEYLFKHIEEKITQKQTQWPILLKPYHAQEMCGNLNAGNATENFLLGAIKRRWKIYFSDFPE